MQNYVYMLLGYIRHSCDSRPMRVTVYKIEDKKALEDRQGNFKIYKLITFN